MAKSIYVGNLPWSATEEQVQNLFAEHGEVLSVKLVNEPAAPAVSASSKWKNPARRLLSKRLITPPSVDVPFASTKRSPALRVPPVTSTPRHEMFRSTRHQAQAWRGGAAGFTQ